MLGVREWQNFRDALAVVESADNPAAIGDNGQAFGRWQMHPAWVISNRVSPMLGDTWDQYFERCLQQYFFSVGRKFFPDAGLLAARQVAMAFHVGHILIPTNVDWDDDYDKKFSRAYEAVQASNAAISSVV